MKKIIAIFTSLILMSNFTYSDELDNKVGLGLYRMESRYVGGDYKNFPLININYENFYMQGLEFGYEFKVSNFTLTPFIKKDSTEGFEKGDLEGFNSNLNDRNNPKIVGGKVGVDIDNLNLELSAFRDFTSDGNNVSAKVSYTKEIFRFLYFLPSFTTTYRDKNYTNYYFNYTETEAANLGFEYYKLDSSLKHELSLGFAMFFSEQVAIYSSYNLELCRSDSYNEHLVEDGVNESLVLMGLYRF